MNRRVNLLLTFIFTLLAAWLLMELITPRAQAQTAPIEGDAPEGVGPATLIWATPTQNSDGSPLTNLEYYTLYWGIVSGQYTEQLRINDVTQTEQALDIQIIGNVGDIVPVFFAITASDSSDNESILSAEISKRFRITDTVPPDSPGQFRFKEQTVTFTCITPSGGQCGLVEIAAL